MALETMTRKQHIAIEDSPSSVPSPGVKIVGDIRPASVLLKAEVLQRAIFDSANFSSIATDEKGVIQIFNVGAERMLGYAAAEVMNKITPADISDPQEVIARAKALSVELGTAIEPGFDALVFKASRGIEDIYELTYIRKDGSRFPAVVSVTALRDAQMAIIGYLLIGTDNTARMRAQEERDRFFNLSQDMLCTLGFDGYFKDLNPAWEKTLGYTKAELMAARFIDFVHPDDRAATLAEAEKLSGGKAPSDFENRYLCKDGSYRYFLWNVRPIPGDRLIFGAARDVTERKRTEAALIEAGALQNAIFNSANFSSIATDAKGVIQIFNVGAERMLGYTAAEVMNKITPAEISDPLEVIARAKALSVELGTAIEPGFDALVFKASRAIEDIYELTYIRKDGSRFPAVVSVTALRDAEKRIIGYLLIGTDNTARKQVEDDRKKLDLELRETNVQLEIAKSAAEKANLAKSDFLSNMSHELRSPLNAILGFAQLMESGDPPPTPSQKEGIDQILKAGWYLLSLINEVLDLAVVESGNVSLSPESVALPELMSECETMMDPQAQQRGIQMNFPKFDHAVFVRADRTRLKQIIVNLLSNAIKYNRKNGRVDVAFTDSEPGRVRFSVRDTGGGLPPEKIAQLFQPFNRLGQETGTVPGTGIGLVVTKRLAESMDGTIGIESKVGEGSVFWCELSAAEPPELPPHDVETNITVLAPLPAAAPRRTLLYVEDNPANLKLVEQLIARRPDMRLLTAVNGTDGIELARTVLPQVILMDINLPGISGIKALKILREDPSTARIPVVALSANAMPRDIAKGMEAGFFGYLTKPIKVKEFTEMLNEAMEFAETARGPNTHQKDK